MKKKPAPRKPPLIVFDKIVKTGPDIEWRLRISVDRFNWIVDYGIDCTSFGLSGAKYYSNVQSMCLGIQGTVIKSLTKEINPEKIRGIVIESENYIIDMTKDIKKLFEDTPFATPEQRHAEAS